MGKALKSYADWRLQESLTEYSFYSKRLKRLLISMFDWSNLPDGISERFIEENLYQHGQLIFFKSKLGFYMVTRCNPIGFNAYDEPTGYRAYTTNGFNELIKAEDCIPIWNDYFREGNTQNVNFYAKKLSRIEKTIDVNMEQLQNPTIVACSESQLASVKAFWAKKNNGEPFIPVDTDFMNQNTFQVFDLKSQNHIPDLMDTKHEYMNEALTFFGINNVNVIKKERLVTGEAEQNDEQIFLNRNAMFKARKEAVEAINEKFGLDIKVELSKDLNIPVEVESEEEEGEEDYE